MLKVLLTGPSGRLGPYLAEPFRQIYDLATFDLQPSDEPQSFVGDLSDIEPLRAAMRGRDVVVHLAATSDEAPFVEQLVGPNVIGVYNVLEAARLEGVRRVVFASSIQAVGAGWHANPHPIDVVSLPRPSTLYGATKIMGETLGRYYHDKHGLEFISLRIGAFQPYDSPHFKRGWCRELWLSPRDAVGIFRAAVEKADIGYGIANATSRTLVERMALQPARDLLGFEPQDDVADFMEQNVETEIASP